MYRTNELSIAQLDFNLVLFWYSRNIATLLLLCWLATNESWRMIRSWHWNTTGFDPPSQYKDVATIHVKMSHLLWSPDFRRVSEREEDLSTWKQQTGFISSTHWLQQRTTAWLDYNWTQVVQKIPCYKRNPDLLTRLWCRFCGGVVARFATIQALQAY